MRLWLGAVAIAAGVLATSTAPAHHSLAIYAPEPLELEGEIVSIAWQNPHVMIELATVGADGAPQTWRMEAGSLTTLARSGVTPELFRVGDRIKIAGRRSRREPFAGLAANILLPDGREAQMLTGAPPRFPGAQVIRGADTVVGDVQAENRGIFRVWSVPTPNPVGGPRCRRCRSRRPPSRRGRRSTCSTTSRRAASPKACRGSCSTRIPSSSSIAARRSRCAPSSTIKSARFTSIVPSRRPASPSSRLGYSVGRWEGRDLVVTTTRVNWPYFDNAGSPQSEAVEIVERFSLNDEQTELAFHVTVTDATTFTAPAVIEGKWLARGDTIARYDCQPRR